MEVKSNILDPISPVLPTSVWDDPESDKPKLKAQHRKWITATVIATLEGAGYTHVTDWLSLVITGSLTTYQYTEDSDCDVSLFVDAKAFPEWSRAEMIATMVTNVDGVTLPGTTYPMQCFVVAPGTTRKDLYKPGLRSGYDLQEDKWVHPPERDRAHDVEKEMYISYVGALIAADKMEALLNHEPDQAVEYWHFIHEKRRHDMKRGLGDYADSNIIYKFLNNRGIFPRLSELTGDYIAKTASAATVNWIPNKEPDSLRGYVADHSFVYDSNKKSIHIGEMDRHHADIYDHLGADWEDDKHLWPGSVMGNKLEYYSGDWPEEHKNAVHQALNTLHRAPFVDGDSDHDNTQDLQQQDGNWTFGKVSIKTPWGQDWDEWNTTRPRWDVHDHQLGFDPEKHAEGKGLVTEDGKVWTWPTSQMRPQHMEMSKRLMRNKQRQLPGSAFHIIRDDQGKGLVAFYGEGRAHSPETQALVTGSDSRLTYDKDPKFAPPEAPSDFGHARGILDIFDKQDPDWRKKAEVGHQGVLNANAGRDLDGLPGAIGVPNHGRLQFHGHAGIQAMAEDYNQTHGIQQQHPTDYMRVQPEVSKRIAEEYERMPHNPSDPHVQAAYGALAKETRAQYDHAVKHGYNFEFYPKHDPYPNSPREAVLDLHHNKHMYVYPTEDGYGTDDQGMDHPLLADSGVKWGGKPVTHNDLFRAVHDFYGHAKEGLGFRADGEDNAYRQHHAMFTPLAQKALAAETRGQNSWVNYGPHGEKNQTAGQADTVFADQKAGILPEWVEHPSIHALKTAARNDTAPRYTPPNHAYTTHRLDHIAINLASRRMGIKGKIEVKHVGGISGGYHGPDQFGTHQISVVNWQKPESASRQTWHELAHAKQYEEGERHGVGYHDTYNQGHDAYTNHPTEIDANSWAEKNPFPLTLPIARQAMATDEQMKVLTYKYRGMGKHPKTPHGRSFPWVYDPDGDALHIGAVDSYHNDLINNSSELNKAFGPQVGNARTDNKTNQVIGRMSAPPNKVMMFFGEVPHDVKRRITDRCDAKTEAEANGNEEGTWQF